jgi:hypothetical protein
MKQWSNETMEQKYLTLNDISAYKIAFHLSNYVWDIVVKWNEKSKARNLIKPDEYTHIYEQLSLLPKDINSLINYTNQKLAV